MVWMWFGFKQITMLFKLCHVQVATTDSNTSNLFYHLRKNQEKEDAESQRLKAAKASNIDESAIRGKARRRPIEEAFARVTPHTHTAPGDGQ